MKGLHSLHLPIGLRGVVDEPPLWVEGAKASSLKVWAKLNKAWAAFVSGFTATTVLLKLGNNFIT